MQSVPFVITDEEGSMQVGDISLAGTVPDLLVKDVLHGVESMWMLAPRIDPTTNKISHVEIKRAKPEPPITREAFDASMAGWAKDIEEDLWVWFQYHIGAISAGEAHAQRDALHEKRRAKIREEERARAKAELIEFMESL